MGTARSVRVSRNVPVDGSTGSHKSVLAWNTALGKWQLTFKDGRRWQFSQPVYGAAPRLWTVADRLGNQLMVSREPITGAGVHRITSPNGRWIDLTVDATNRVT